eukprot:c10823_g1_i1.p1 GENE.c10823_g1_i1~~c10823_g1_i1.p1  ORF type:complete len:288 (+),score=76.15 c10823_g1_i1:47-910(+)
MTKNDNNKTNSWISVRLRFFCSLTVIIFFSISFPLTILVPGFNDSSDYFNDRIVYLIIFGILYCLMIISFIQTCLIDPGVVPDWFQEPDFTSDRFRIIVVEKKSDGSKRFCTKCKFLKPDRTHHCRICGRCVLKMDHHCPWVNNCIGYFNYKYFFLLICYSFASLTCVYIFSLEKAMKLGFDSINDNILLFIQLFISGVLAFFLFTFVIFHTGLIINNFTTIEFFEKKMRSRYLHENYYNVGVWKNLTRVLGNFPLFWFLPIRICMVDQGKGTSFDVNNLYAQAFEN